MPGWKALKDKLGEILSSHSEQRPLIVALDGLSGSGKTTLGNRLQKDLQNSLILHIDDYITVKNKRYGTGHNEWYEYYQLQWDTCRLKENLFEKLHQNVTTLSLPYYNFEQDTCTDQLINLSSIQIVIIEGVFLLREEWKAYYDHIIFLDCQKDTRYDRTLQRDTYIGNMEARLKKYQRRYWIAEEHYLHKQRPLELAHTILKEI